MSNPPRNQMSDLIAQISKNLSNTRSTFGSSSPQYQAVFETLQVCIRETEREKQQPDSDGGVEELRMLLERELRLMG